MHVILIGPQGSGKGTQAELLGPRNWRINSLPAMLFAAEIAAETPLGLR